jgi:hypothetical protein
MEAAAGQVDPDECLAYMCNVMYLKQTGMAPPWVSDGSYLDDAGRFLEESMVWLGAHTSVVDGDAPRPLPYAEVCLAALRRVNADQVPGNV